MQQSSIWKSLLACFILLLAACDEDPEAAANRLFVEASTYTQQAAALVGEGADVLSQRIELLSSAIANLSKISSEFPESSLAVELVATGSVKGLVVAELESNLEEARALLSCSEKTNDAQCLLDDILRNVMSGALEAERAHYVIPAFILANRIDDALSISLMEGVDAPDDYIEAILFSGWLSNDSETIQHAISFLVDGQSLEADRIERLREEFRQMELRYREQLQLINWQLVSSMQREFSVSPMEADYLLSDEDQGSRREEVRNAIRIGDLARFQELAISSFLPAYELFLSGNYDAWRSWWFGVSSDMNFGLR